MRYFRKLLLVLVSVTGGCVALTSEIDDQGMVYYLPKTILNIAVWQHRDLATGRTWYNLGGITKAKPNEDPAPQTPTDEIKSESIPDPKHRYVIKYRPSPLSDDRLCLSRSPSGLLHDVQFAADDRTPQVVFNVARFISATVGGPKPAFYFDTGDKQQKVRSRAYSGKVDPFDDGDIYAFNQALKHVFNERLRLDMHRMREMVAPSREAWPDECDDDDCPRETWQKICEPENICYRTKLSLPIDLYRGKHLVDMKYAEVINAWDIGAISVTRAFLVHKITKLRFQKGALVAAVIRKPSEVEELSLLPIHVLNAALITPSGLWAAAFSSNNSQAEKLLKKMDTLKTQVAGLNTALTSIVADGGGPALPKATEEKYALDCRAADRSNLSINLLSAN